MLLIWLFAVVVTGVAIAGISAYIKHDALVWRRRRLQEVEAYWDRMQELADQGIDPTTAHKPLWME